MRKSLPTPVRCAVGFERQVLGRVGGYTPSARRVWLDPQARRNDGSPTPALWMHRRSVDGRAGLGVPATVLGVRPLPIGAEPDHLRVLPNQSAELASFRHRDALQVLRGNGLGEDL